MQRSSLTLPAILICTLGALALPPPDAAAQGQRGQGAQQQVRDAPDLTRLVRVTESEMRPVANRFNADRAVLLRRYDAETAAKRERLRAFYGAWRTRLREIDFDALSPEARLDYLNLHRRLRSELESLDETERELAELAPLLPFHERLAGLQEARRRLETLEPQAAAATLDETAREIEATRGAVEAFAQQADDSRALGERAVALLEDLRATVRSWYGFYHAYDPLFTWWCEAPYERLDRALRDYTSLVQEQLVDTGRQR